MYYGIYDEDTITKIKPIDAILNKSKKILKNAKKSDIINKDRLKKNRI